MNVNGCWGRSKLLRFITHIMIPTFVLSTFQKILQSVLSGSPSAVSLHFLSFRVRSGICFSIKPKVDCRRKGRKHLGELTFSQKRPAWDVNSRDINNSRILSCYPMASPDLLVNAIVPRFLHYMLAENNSKRGSLSIHSRPNFKRRHQHFQCFACWRFSKI